MLLNLSIKLYEFIPKSNINEFNKYLLEIESIINYAFLSLILLLVLKVYKSIFNISNQFAL